MHTKYLLLAAGLFAVGSLVAPAGATAQDDLTKQLAGVEQRLWKGWAEGDATPLRHHATANYITIGDWGMMVGRDANIQATAAHSCDVKSYELDDWQLHRLSDETAVLTYEAEQDAVCDGTPVAPEVMVSAVYVMEDGEWKAGSYHETPIAEDDEGGEPDEDDADDEDDDGTDDDGR
jgi:hypothetical protein